MRRARILPDWQAAAFGLAIAAALGFLHALAGASWTRVTIHALAGIVWYWRGVMLARWHP